MIISEEAGKKLCYMELEEYEDQLNDMFDYYNNVYEGCCNNEY